VKVGRHGLPLRSAVIAKRRRRLRILAAIATLSLFGFIGGVAYEIWPERAQVIADVSAALGSTAPAAATPVAVTVPTRPVYRHSIVPGGAYSRREVADAMRKDAVVAAHYQDVDIDKVHTKTVAAARAVYVSYRVGSQVYWTKNRVHIAAGETVLTDGKTEIRARCGNLLSDNAQGPVAAEEPPVAQLDEADETGSSTFAAERGPEDQLPHVPFMKEMSESNAVALNTADPDSHGTLDTPMWSGGAGGAIAPFVGSSTGTNGTSLVTPLGSGGRPDKGTPNGGGSNGGGSNGGGSNGGGSNGGGSNGGGSNGGGNPTTTTGGTDTTGGIQTTGGTETTGTVTTGGIQTTGGTETTGTVTTTTTGNVVSDTTGGSDGTGQSVPEPTTMVLLGLGLCGAAARAVRRNRQ